MGQYKVVVEQRSRRRWAAYGFLLIVALMTISWFLAPTVISTSKSLTKERFPPAGTLTPVQTQIIFTLVVFVVLALIAALIVTIAAPKRALNVNDKDLIKEREENQKYRRMARKRQRTLNREMREFVEKNQQK